jgi:hypothetical protein
VSRSSGYLAAVAGGASRDCFRLTIILCYSMTFTAVLTQKERRAFRVTTASVISRRQKMPEESERYREGRNPRDRAMYNWKGRTRVLGVERATNMGVVGLWPQTEGRKRHESPDEELGRVGEMPMNS